MRTVRNRLDGALSWVCVALFAVLVLTVAWQVFSRQVLAAPSSWSEQLAKYVFVWLGMFGAALVFSERGHIAVDLLVRKCSVRGQRIAAAAVQVCIIAFAALALIWGGIRMTALAWGQSLTALPGHEGLFRLVMPVTGVLIVYFAVEELASVLRRQDPPLPDGDGANEAI